jgi:hypothetical protein
MFWFAFEFATIGLLLLAMPTADPVPFVQALLLVVSRGREVAVLIPVLILVGVLVFVFAFVVFVLLEVGARVFAGLLKFGIVEAGASR